jgi:hypothetical protein
MYEDYAYGTTSGGGDMVFGAFAWFVVIALYLYFSFMQYRIASNKTGNADVAWWAFIPILNTILLIKMAEKPMWWFFLLLVPFVNIFAWFALWMSVAKNCGQSQVWGFLVLIPLINFVAIFILAYGGKTTYETPPEEKKHPVSIS